MPTTRALTLSVERNVVRVSRPGLLPEEIPAVVAVQAHGASPEVVAVGETEAELSDRFRHLVSTGTLSDLPVLVRPGDDPRSDELWRWATPSIATRAADGPDAPESILVLNPLDRVSWSPRIAHALFRYALFRGASWTERASSLLRPAVQVTASADFDQLEYEEIVDMLRDAWGRWRVSLPVTRPVPPPPLQTIDVVAAVSGVASVLALLGPLAIIFAVGYSHATRLTLLVAWPCALVLLYVARTLREGRRLAPRRRLQPRQNGKPLPS